MTNYEIPKEAARLLAVGLFREIFAFIQAADPVEYGQFKAAYEARQTAQAAPIKRRKPRNRSAVSR